MPCTAAAEAALPTAVCQVLMMVMQASGNQGNLFHALSFHFQLRGDLLHVQLEADGARMLFTILFLDC